jgi:hypothetical protein
MIVVKKTFRLLLVVLFTGMHVIVYSGALIQPVPPILARECVQTMIYKIISERYREPLEILDNYWHLSSGALRSPQVREQVLEELMMSLEKIATPENNYREMVELDLMTVGRITDIPHTVIAMAPWLPESLTKLQDALRLLHKILKEDYSFLLLTNVYAKASTCFASELSLLRSKQRETLVRYMRTNRQDYAKDLIFWSERLISALLITNNRYPHLSKEADSLGKHLEALKQIYAKI